MDPYKVLGIERNASFLEIKKAYRERSKECHPDSPSGSDQAFTELNLAYRVLSDDKKRTLYDESGIVEDEAPDHIQNMVKGRLAELASKWIDNMLRGDKVPLKEFILNGLNNGENRLQLVIKDIKEIIENLVDIRKRLTHKDGNSLIHNIIDERIIINKKSIKANEEELIILDKLKEILEDYNFEEGKEEEMITMLNSSSTTSTFRGASFNRYYKL